jgi:ankyrin repeat protein
MLFLIPASLIFASVHACFCTLVVQPLHEGARAGQLEVVKYLVEQGADLNVKTGGKGGSALWWAKQKLEEDHPVIAFLESYGALEIGPDL